MLHYGRSEKGEDCICKQYAKRISVRGALNLTETTVNCTAAFNIRFAANFEHFHVARISICFHGNIALSTVLKLLLHILPQVQPKLTLLSPC